MARRYKLTVEYHGGAFVGWQRQENGYSVQQALEEAVEAYCGERVTSASAGRTDAGVHALGMVAHVDLARADAPETVRDAINFHLKPNRIAVIQAERVSQDFHARFSALRRHYEYRIVNRRAPLALERGLAWRVTAPLDADAMGAAAQVLVGKHDFTTFRASECQAKSPVKTLERLEVERAGEYVLIGAHAPSFLHHQIRSIVGTLARVGAGKWAKEDVRNALEARDRTACGPVAPAEGLYFVAADYPETD